MEHRFQDPAFNQRLSRHDNEHKEGNTEKEEIPNSLRVVDKSILETQTRNGAEPERGSMDLRKIH